MPNTPWKQFERFCGRLFGGARFKANTGGGLDFETPTAVGQCKLVRILSLEELTKLAEHAAIDGESVNKLGVVCVKVRRGTGKKSPALVVMTSEMFDEWFSMRIRERKERERNITDFETAEAISRRIIGQPPTIGERGSA